MDLPVPADETKFEEILLLPAAGGQRSTQHQQMPSAPALETGNGVTQGLAVPTPAILGDPETPHRAREVGKEQRG